MRIAGGSMESEDKSFWEEGTCFEWMTMAGYGQKNVWGNDVPI